MGSGLPSGKGHRFKDSGVLIWRSASLDLHLVAEPFSTGLLSSSACENS